MNRSGFSPDVRNKGGRKIVVDLLSKHLLALNAIHSTQVVAPPFSVRRRFSQTFSATRAYNERQLAQSQMKLNVKLGSVHSIVRSAQPVTFNLIRKGDPQCITSKRVQFEMEEHRMRLASQSKRLDTINQHRPRRTSVFDYQQMMTTKQQYRSINDLSDEIECAVVRQHDILTRKRSRLYSATSAITLSSAPSQFRSDSKIASVTFRPSRPLTATAATEISSRNKVATMPSYNSNSIYQIGNCSRLEGSRNSNDSRLDNSSTKVRNNNKWMQISEKIPVLDDLTEESVSELKLRLIEIIAEFRMYKNEDFETLQNLFESKNQIIGKYVAQEVFIEILEALSS